MFVGSAFFYPMMGKPISFGLAVGAISVVLAWIGFWIWGMISKEKQDG
jgi:hypothetical protein